MAIIFLFLGAPDSFLILNGSAVQFKGLSPAIRDKVNSGKFNGMDLAYLTGGPNGWYFAKIMSNNSYDTVGPAEMIPYLKPDIDTYPRPPRLIEHVSFTASGGWFHKYSDGSVRWSTKNAMPNTFHEMIGYLRKNYAGAGGENMIKFVSFGSGNDYVCGLSNGLILFDDEMPKHIIDKIMTRSKDEWTLGMPSSLCQYDRDQYFFYWTKGNKVEVDHNLSPSISQMVQEVITGVGKNHTTEMMNQMMQLQAARLRNNFL